MHNIKYHVLLFEYIVSKLAEYKTHTSVAVYPDTFAKLKQLKDFCDEHAGHVRTFRCLAHAVEDAIMFYWVRNKEKQRHENT